MLESQAAFEHYMVTQGHDIALARIEKAEERGTGYANPYAKTLFSRYIPAMVELIGAWLGKKTPGFRAAAKVTLAKLPSDTVAYIALRSAMATIGDCNGAIPQSRLASVLGKAISGELLLKDFEDIRPEVFNAMLSSMQARASRDVEYRIKQAVAQADSLGISLSHLEPKAYAEVGAALLYFLTASGFVTTSTRQLARVKRETLVEYSPEVMAVMSQISGYVASMTTLHMPCIEPPMDWVSPNCGGYHTKAMRRSYSCVMRGRAAVEDSDVSALNLRAVNALQQQSWEVNGFIYETILACQQTMDVGEVMLQGDYPKPRRPFWLDHMDDLKEMSLEQSLEFKQWKREMRDWHNESKTRVSKMWKLHNAMSVADLLKGRPLWFVYTMDFRGRKYAVTSGISPQGSDLSKALLRAHKGMRIGDSPDVIAAFKIAGANRFGFDKAPMHERVKWTEDNTHIILACAADPLSNTLWKEADSPFQFLAWCKEYSDYLEQGAEFVTHLPLGQDGTCNGLQHYSAMMRDPVGGAAVNLVPDDYQHDIYGDVAKVTAELVAKAPYDDEGIAARWKEHTLTRSITKRSVMTLPYGATRFSCSEFILKEYMEEGKAPEFSKDEYRAAAR